MKSAEQIAKEFMSTWGDHCEKVGATTFSPYSLTFIQEGFTQAITAERERAKVLLEACEFYGNVENWDGYEPDDKTSIHSEDWDSNGSHTYKGGKRARAALAKYKGEMG